MILDQCGHAWSLVSSAKRHFWWDMAITLTLELSCYKISWMMKAWHAKVSNQHGSSCHRFRFTTKSNETLPPPSRDWVGEKMRILFTFSRPRSQWHFEHIRCTLLALWLRGGSRLQRARSKSNYGFSYLPTEIHPWFQFHFTNQSIIWVRKQ